MRKRKVLLVVNELLRGGGQRIVLDTAKTIDASQFEVAIVCLKSAEMFTGESLYSEADDSGVRVIQIGGMPGTSVWEAIKLWKLFVLEKPDVVHTFLPYAGVIGRITARLAGVPRIFTTQCNLAVAYTPFWFLLDSVTLRLATAWIAVTEGIELSNASSASHFSKDLWNEGRRHFTVVAGVDLPAFDMRLTETHREDTRTALGLSEESVMVLMIARLVLWKGNGDLVAALEHLPNHAHVFIVGWGPMEKELLLQAKELGVEDRLHLLGARNDVIELLAASDVYAATHKRETNGNIWMGANIAQMEACAAHVPSMSTAVPYIENLIEDHVTGLLAEINNPKDIARAIHELSINKEQAQRFADAARKRVEERYSLAAMMSVYEELYQM